ncbi:hypothetical protein ACX1C1_20070 [Paenibacillus sp. strain BS8-2]
MKFRSITISLTILILIGTVTSYFLLRVPESEVVVQQMIRFHEVRPGTERVITDSEAVKQFTYAVRYADKQHGQVDIEDPPYQFSLGNKQYYLWVSERYGQGTLSKLPNSGTVYTIGKSRAKKLLDILNKEYDNSNKNNE